MCFVCAQCVCVLGVSTQRRAVCCVSLQSQTLLIFLINDATSGGKVAIPEGGGGEGHDWWVNGDGGGVNG